MVTRARFERTGFALHVGCAHGRNHKLLPHRSQFAPNFFSEAGAQGANVLRRLKNLW